MTSITARTITPVTITNFHTETPAGGTSSAVELEESLSVYQILGYAMGESTALMGEILSLINCLVL